MSDFDKEAERRRLREKYDQESEDREITQRMSELLLQGATMTNVHCNQCNSPLFRYEGRDFCPTCEEEKSISDAGEQGAATSTDAGTDESDTDTNASADTAAGTSDADTGAGTTGAGAEPESGQTGEETDAGDVGTGGQSPARAQADPGTDSPGTRPGTSAPPVGAGQPETGTGAGATTASTDADADLDAARASLVRTLTSLARRAEETRDVGHARECLEGAREAAAALSELERLR